MRPERIAENFDVFKFELTTAELKALDALDTGMRGGPEPDDITLQAYGRLIPKPDVTEGSPTDDHASGQP